MNRLNNGESEKTTHHPDVTVVVVVFNHERYVEECLDSLVHTGFGALEILIIDDASSDASDTVIRNWMQRHTDQNTVYVNHPQNMGLINTLNEAIGIAQGQYLCFISGDDVMMPNGIVDRLRYLMRHPDKLAVFADCHVIGERGNQLFLSGIEQLYPKKGMKKEELRIDSLVPSCVVFHWAVPGPVFMSRAETFQIVGPYDEQFALEDWDMYLRIAALGKLGFCDEYVSKYRLHDQNVVRTRKPLLGREIAQIARKNAPRYRAIDAVRLRGIYAFWKYREAKEVLAKVFYFFLTGFLLVFAGWAHRGRKYFLARRRARDESSR